MTPRERAFAAMELKKPDKIPFHAYESPEHAIRQLGRKVHEMYFEPTLVPEAMVNTAKMYHNDIVMMRCVTVLPENLEAVPRKKEGGAIFRDKKTGEIVGHVDDDIKTIVYNPDYKASKAPKKAKSINDIPDAMKIKTVNDYMQEEATLQTLKIYQDEFKDERLLLGWGAGQTANIIATALGEEEAMIKTVEDPELCRAIMERRFEQCKEYWTFQKQMGIEAVYTGDAYASCSLYSPETYRSLFFEYHKKSIDFVHSLGMKALLHICGCINDILEDMAATGADAIESLDRPSSGGDVELKEAKRRVGDKVCLKGNIDAVHEIEPGPPEKVYEYCMQAMRDTGPEGYILSTEQITRDTPKEHVLAMIQARDDFAAKEM